MIKEYFKTNHLVSKLSTSVDASKDSDDINIKFNVHELTALANVAFEAYNLFAEDQSNGSEFSSEVNYFLDNLHSALDKLNSF